MRHGKLTSALRPLVVGLLLVSSWRSLSTWYYYQHHRDFYLALAAFLPAAALAIGPALFSRNRPAATRLLIALPVLVLLIPWAELVKSSFGLSHEDWSRKILFQFSLVYGLYLLFLVFPRMGSLICSLADRFLHWMGSRKPLLYAPVAVFLGLSIYAAFVINRQTPIFLDSASHLFQARVFLAGRLFAPIPQPQALFDMKGDALCMKDGKWFTMYQPGFAAILAPFLPLHLEWAACPLLVSLSLLLWILYARRWHGPAAAACLAILGCFSPFLIKVASSVLIHSPELFLTTAIIYLIRSQLEKASSSGLLLLAFACFAAMLVRSFSILPFLAPVLLYVAWRGMKDRSLRILLSLGLGFAVGAAMLGWFQWATTGDPLQSGYGIECPGEPYGCGETFAGKNTPLRALENTSNNFHGLNIWLNGWYSGSLFFVIAFILLNKRIDAWDKLLGGGICLIVVLYSFHPFQDLFFGPRFYYVFAPFLLLLLARFCVTQDDAVHPGLRALPVLCLLAALPLQYRSFLVRYLPATQIQGYLVKELSQLKDKTLIILHPEIQQSLVGFNDPFLRGNAVIVRYTKPLSEIEADFPGRNVMFFEPQQGLKPGYGLSKQMTGRPGGFISAYDLITNLLVSVNLPDKDLFDVCYSGFFKSSPALHLAWVNEHRPEPLTAGYRGQFDWAVYHSERYLLLPLVALEKNRSRWLDSFDAGSFRSEFFAARKCFEASGDIGRDPALQMEKVARRIDQDGDGSLSDEELKEYLQPKLRTFELGM